MEMFEDLERKLGTYKALVERKKQLDALLDRAGNNLELANAVNSLLLETAKWVERILNFPIVSQTTKEKVQAFLEESTFLEVSNLVDKNEAMYLIACYPMCMNIEDKSAEGYLIIKVEVFLNEGEYRGFVYNNAIHSIAALRTFLDATQADYME